MKPIIAISMGDFNGIGPEVILKSLETANLAHSTPLILGSETVLHYYQSLLKTDVKWQLIESIGNIQPDAVNLMSIWEPDPGAIDPGHVSKPAGALSMESVERGIELCLENACHALVTAPISKEAIGKAGYSYPGHTEFLAEKTGCSRFMMILASNSLRVGLVTGHIPVSQVSSSISEDLILDKLHTFNQSLRNDFGIEHPKIAVFGLNPHAGDGGVIGDEEIRIIEPAIGKAQEAGILAEGPFPADGFFGKRHQEQYHGILAIYHDQGLIPFKALTFGSGVNFTAGLPIVRTSPDHGTAFNIAGLGEADPSSFTSAYRLAAEMAFRKFQSSVKSS
jgi:4-hydroxythreonine-4-phosphate dehydrogenase